MILEIVQMIYDLKGLKIPSSNRRTSAQMHVWRACMMLFSVYNVSDRYIASNTMLKAAAMCPMARKKTAKHIYNSHSTLKATVRFASFSQNLGCMAPYQISNWWIWPRPSPKQLLNLAKTNSMKCVCHDIVGSYLKTSDPQKMNLTSLYYHYHLFLITNGDMLSSPYPNWNKRNGLLENSGAKKFLLW